MKKNGHQSGFRTAAVIGLLAATAVMARPMSGRGSREAVALDEVVLISKVVPSGPDSPDKTKGTVPITGTFLGMLGGMLGQGEPPPENPGVVISDALGDGGGGDIEGAIFGANFMGGVLFGSP